MNNELEACYVELCEWIGLVPTSEENTSAKAEPAAAVEEPPAVENVVQHVWQQVADGSSGQFYYYNIETQETSWDVPEGGFAAVEAEAATSEPSAVEEPAAAVPEVVQTVADGTMAKACLQEQLIGEAAVVEPSSTSAEVVWQQHFDSGSGYYFYTQVGQAEQVPLWERPEKGRVQHVWKQVADGSSGQFYYYNTATGETKWEEPDAAYDVAEASAPVDLFASLDVNGDGVIDKAEFAAAVSVFLLLQ